MTLRVSPQQKETNSSGSERNNDPLPAPVPGCPLSLPGGQLTVAQSQTGLDVLSLAAAEIGAAWGEPALRLRQCNAPEQRSFILLRLLPIAHRAREPVLPHQKL